MVKEDVMIVTAQTTVTSRLWVSKRSAVILTISFSLESQF